MQQGIHINDSAANYSANQREKALQSITAEKVYFEEEKYYNVCGNTSESVKRMNLKQQ